MIRRFFTEHIDIALWAKSIAGNLVAQGIVDAEDREVYEYGVDILIYTILSLGCILILGGLLGLFGTTFFFLLAPIPLQGLGGGFHASTHLKCFLTLLLSYLAGMALCILLPPLPALLLGALGLGAIFLLAPIEHENAPMSAGKAVRMKRFARSYGAILFAAAAVLTILNIPIGAAIAVGVFTSGVSMSAATLLKRQK